MFNQTNLKIPVTGLRVIQLISIASTITGFIWSSSDLITTTLLIGIPVTPMSVLMMLYGSIGTVLSEISIRIIKRQIPKA